MTVGSGTFCAIPAGERQMPEPSAIPTTSATPLQRPSVRGRRSEVPTAVAIRGEAYHGMVRLNPDGTCEYAGTDSEDVRLKKGVDQMNAQVNVADAERWASALGGAALTAWGLKQLRDQRSPAAAMVAAAGASLIVRGATGHCAIYSAARVSTADTDTRAVLAGSRGTNVEQSMTINRSPAELYGYWRQLDQLPQFMRHLVSVRQLDDLRSHWVAKGPGGRRFEWDAEIINEIPNELIAWRTLESANVVSTGSVRFKSTSGGRGTEVHVHLQYSPPAGK